MNNTKFTKGEWSVFTGTSNTVEITANDTAIVSWQGFDDLNCLESEKTANAHLIAAAPEMYKMIESLMSELAHTITECNKHRASHITSQTESEPDYIDMQTISDASWLLTKARGER